MVARLHFETMVFWPGRTWSSGPSAPAGDLGCLAGRAIPARRDRPAAGLHRQPVPATL